MANNRADRDNSTREAETRAKSWSPPSTLPDPVPAPGWKYRWIRTSMLGQADLQNVSVRMREGWEPVPSEEVPELPGLYAWYLNFINPQEFSDPVNFLTKYEPYVNALNSDSEEEQKDPQGGKFVANLSGPGLFGIGPRWTHAPAGPRR